MITMRGEKVDKERERERDKSFKKKRASVWQYINMNF